MDGHEQVFSALERLGESGTELPNSHRCTLSKDDGVYILESSERKSGNKEYRIAHAHAIENIFSDQSLIFATFEHSKVYPDLKTTQENASQLERDKRTEYGIMLIDHFRDKDWREIELMGELEHPSHV